MNLSQAEHYAYYPGIIDPGFDEDEFECNCGAEDPDDCTCDPETRAADEAADRIMDDMTERGENW